MLRRLWSIVLGKSWWSSKLTMAPTWGSWSVALSGWRTWSEPSRQQSISWTNSLSKLLGKEFSSAPIWLDHLSRPLALILGETRGLRSKLCLRLSSQDNNHIHVKGHTPHQGVEEIYAELMTQEETYLFVRELTIGGASSEVWDQAKEGTSCWLGEQWVRKEDRCEHPALRRPARREHSHSIASGSIFDRVRKSVGDVDRDQGRDLHDRLRHSRRESPSSTSTRSANQPWRM